MKIKCIVIEDEPKAMSLMEDHILKTPFLELSARFYGAVEALAFLEKQPEINLVFSDIDLPEITGIELAKMIKPSVHIIFTTAHSNYAVDSYEVKTIDYLLKPITYNRFLQAALKAQQTLEKEITDAPSETSVFVKSGKKIIQINWEEVYYIEALKEYASIASLNQKVVIYKRMNEFENIQPRSFKRVHNSYIVNLQKIEKVEDNTIYMLQKEIPIGKTYKDEFFSAIQKRFI